MRRTIVLTASLEKITIAFLLLLFVSPAYAQRVFNYSGVAFRTSYAKTAVVIARKGGYSGDVVVPAVARYAGTSYRVTTVDSAAFALCPNLRSVVLPSSVTKIGKCAFQYSTNLQKVVLPDLLTTIPDRAFECTAIESISIPSKVDSIGKYAFATTKLKAIPALARVRRLAQGVFSGCYEMKSFDVPEGIVAIDADAFSSWQTTTRISVPRSVQYIAPDAFGICPNVVSVEFAPGAQLHSLQRNFFFFSPLQNFPAVTVPEMVEEVAPGGFVASARQDYLFYNAANCRRTGNGDEFALSAPLTIFIGKSVESLPDHVFYTTAANLPRAVVCLDSVPPICCGEPFTPRAYETVTLYIPKGTRSAFAAAEQWRRFCNVVEFVPAREVVLRSRHVSLQPGDRGYINAKVSPENALPFLICTSDNHDSVLPIRAGTIIARSSGSALVEVKTLDGSGVATSFSVAVGGL